jgi:hypothetical protein
MLNADMLSVVAPKFRWLNAAAGEGKRHRSEKMFGPSFQL